ncbi:MAG: hypothetical protein INR62_06425 [Rhodospirillales bacterium]|nr:hypothetical protein [Acetobacter sp.]
MRFELNTLMQSIHKDNPTFKRFARTSDMDPLLKLLGPYNVITILKPDFQKQIQRAVAALPPGCRQKYQSSLRYVANTFGVKNSAMPVRPKIAFVKFGYKTGGYVGYNKAGKSDFVMLDGTKGRAGQLGFIHRHKVTWSSSDGNLASLGSVLSREHVKFLTDTQAPPFNKCADPDREFYQPQSGSQATEGGSDDHSTSLPMLICAYPRVPGRIVAEQWYQYSTDGGRTWTNIDEAAYLLEKSVRQEGNRWIFTFKKTNWAPHNNNPFHFEVDYLINDPAEYMPRDHSDIKASLADVDNKDINKHALRVIHRPQM